MSQNRLPGIANPQDTKRLGHFLTTDCKSVETPNGILSLVLRSKSQSVILNIPVPADLKSAVKKGSTHENGGFVIPL